MGAIFSCLMMCRSFITKIVSNIRGTTTYIPEEPPSPTEACMPNDYLLQDPLLMDENFPLVKYEGLPIEACMPNALVSDHLLMDEICPIEDPSTEACMPDDYNFLFDPLFMEDYFSQIKPNKINSMPEEEQATEASSMGIIIRTGGTRGASVACRRIRMGSSYNGHPVSNYITLTLDEITRTLTRPDIIMLGVYGSSNAKNDIVVDRISRRVKRDNLFDLIVRASIMKKPDLERIQGELGNMLGLQLHGKKLEGRSRLLCNRIKMTEKVLIILDEVWGEINLGKIGIPFGNNHKGCKILLISETQNMLFNQTNAQIKFTV